MKNNDNPKNVYRISTCVNDGAPSGADGKCLSGSRSIAGERSLHGLHLPDKSGRIDRQLEKLLEIHPGRR
jgi:hypothetical protein